MADFFLGTTNKVPTPKVGYIPGKIPIIRNIFSVTRVEDVPFDMVFEYDISDVSDFSNILLSGNVTDTGIDISSLGDGTLYIRVKATSASTSKASAYVTFQITKDFVFLITSSAGENGIINPDGQNYFDYHTSPNITSTADATYMIAALNVDGNSIPGAENQNSYVYTFTNIEADHAITVTFTRQPKITSSAGENGTIDPLGDVYVPYNDELTFAITANEGYAIESLFVDLINIPEAVGLTTYIYRFLDVIADHTIDVTFGPTG